MTVALDTLPSASQVAEAIVEGMYDAEGMARIERAVQARRQADAQAQASLLSPGDVVRIREDAGIRPAYLLGTTWVVTKVNVKTVGAKPTGETREALAAPRKYAGGIRMPLTCMEPAG